MKKIISIIALIIIMLSSFLMYHMHKPVLVTSEEVFADDEAVHIQRSINTFLALMEKNQTSYVARGAHSKAHGCVKAWFEINQDIPAELKQGVFQSPGQKYKSWIRFSNAASNVQNNDDRQRDARGMAIKIINLYEQGIAKQAGMPDYQDFLMHDSPAFFVANMQHYNEFTNSENQMLYFIQAANPFNWRVRELKNALSTLKKPPSSPLNNQYYSNTAYKLGPHNIKFSARACHLSQSEAVPDEDENFLGKTMAEELKNQAGCFDFMVQLQKPNRQMPIENASVLWKESDSEFIKLAKINIPVQNFAAAEQQQLCENLSFSPFNSLEAHKPIGGLNRIREKVYAASSKFRHEKNASELPTNLNW